jgi:hypothetical protein
MSYLSSALRLAEELHDVSLVVQHEDETQWRLFDVDDL